MTDLERYIDSCRDQHFQWGKLDCFCFAAGAVQAHTGIDHMAQLRDYADETSATILLRERFGTGKLRDAFLCVAQEHAVQVALEDARDGDVACVKWPGQRFVAEHEMDQQYGLGVVFGHVVWAMAPKGLVAVPMTHRVVDLWRF
jgi:hypothetical protein